MAASPSNQLRRAITSLVTATCVCFATASAVAQDSTPSKDLRVKTKQGEIYGKRAGSVRVFLGIPYAQPPVGPLRWRPPVAEAKWKGVRKTQDFGFRCMQPYVNADMIFRDPGNSEDCLNLNVWTPAKNKKSKLPVMVWVYGGGFNSGSTSEARQDGANLTKNGVIVVSMNYRLGIFGFFAHPALAAESGRDASGNYGLLDQVAALTWVQQNISAFGGDPNNVTLFGESAGSYSVSVQMASPLAKGLFQRAIGESGGAFSRSVISFPSAKQAEEHGLAFAHAAFGDDTLEQLRAIPADQMMAASIKKPENGAALRFSPDIDGYLLPQSVAAIFAAGKQNDVPLLAGWNRDEGGFNPKVTLSSFHDSVTKQYGPDAADILSVYTASDDAEAVRSAADLARDRFIAFSTWRWIGAQVATGKQPAYRYRFDLVSPADPYHTGGLAAYHSSEIPYVFGNMDLLHGFAWRPEDYALSEKMQRYWTNFARSGNPNGQDLVKWPVYDSATDWEVLHLSPRTFAEPDKDRPRDLMLDRIEGK